MADPAPNPFAAFANTTALTPPEANPFAAFAPVSKPDFFAKLGPNGDALAAQPSGISAILHAYGQGVENAWGDQPLGLSPENQQWMRDHGIFNDFQKSSTSFWKTLNEAVIRDSAFVADLAQRGAVALTYGGVKGIAETPGVPAIAAVPAGIATAGMEAFPAGHLTGFPTPALPTAPGLSILNAARAAKIIGPEDEAGWKGTAAPAEAPPAAPAPEPAATPSPAGVAAEATPPPEPAPAAAPAPDLHETARQLAPDVFGEYDAASLRRDTFRQWISDLSDMRDQGTSPAITELDRNIDALRSARLEAAPADRPGMANDITALEEQRRGLADALPAQGDTPEMAMLRQHLMDADFRMRDLAPDVRAAYQRAAGGEQAPEMAEPVVEPPAPEAVAAPAAAPPEAAPAIPEPTGHPPPMPIAADVSRQLVAAGRPQDEADAAGALVAARYEARAAAFGGAKGSAADLYAAEAPRIQRGSARARRGNFRIAADQAQATIRLFGNADASTFIHETGHDWLEQLVRDAADEKAPEQLQTDAQTVRDWLKAPEEISTGAHEKFARGFERYMMEGHAPSAGLARVFEQFKGWLTQIYQTVNRLRAPITDDIRSVFDRMLTQPPGRVVVPEREPTGTFADLHETDAENTPPEHAAEIADLIEAERDRVASTQLPEETDVRRRNRRAGAEVAGFERRNRLPDGGGIGEQPGPGSEAVAAQPEPVGEGGTAIAAQKPGVDAGSEPAARLPGTGNRLLDKAGNIRLDNIESPEDIKQAMRDSADRNDEFLQQRRGIVSDQQREDLATLLGTTPDKVLTRGIGEAFTDSEIKFLEKTLAQSAASLQELAGKALASGTDQDRLAATEALLRHDMVQGLFSQATAEAGRALRALRRSQEYWSREATATADIAKQVMDDATGRTFNQMDAIFRRIVSLDQTGKVSKFVRDTQKPGLFDWIQSVWINALLSGPFTHATYTAAGQIFGLFRSGVELPASALAGAIRQQIRGGEDGIRLGEARAAFFGQGRGIQEGMRAAWTSWNSGATELPAEVTRTLAGGSGQAIMGRVGIIPGRVGTVLEAPGRMVAALHSFNWTSFYRQSIAAQAYRAAVHEGLPEGSPAFVRRVAQLSQEPTEEMIKEGAADASGGALVTRPDFNSIMGTISRVMNLGVKVPDITVAGHTVPMGTLRIGKYIDPFVQIQGNILKQALGRGTPFMLFSKAARDDLAGRNGAAAFDLRAGKLLAGTAFMTAAGALWAAGTLNDSGPSDPRQAAAYRRRNGMAHGLKVGDLTFNILRMGNLGLQMSIAADLARSIGHMAEGDVHQVAADLVQSFAGNIIDESFMRGPQEIMQAIDDPDRYGARWIRSFASSAIPFSVGLGQVTHEIDPYARRARTVIDAVKAKIPGLSSEVAPLYDVWGQPVSSEGWALTYYEHVARNDPVEMELNRLSIYPSMPEARIRGVVLTDAQYAEYSRNAGHIAKSRLDQMIGSPVWQALPDAARIEAVNGALKAARAFARSTVMMGNPGIVSTAMRAKAAQAGGATAPQVREILGRQ